MAQSDVSQFPVLLVDDEAPILRSASVSLRASGMDHVVTLEDSRAVLPLVAEQDVGVVVLDLTMPHLSGQVLLEHLAADYPDLPVIVLTATNDLEMAVRRALEVRALRAEVLSLKERFLTDRPHQREVFAEIVTQSKAMHNIFRYVEAIAPSRADHR